MLGRSAALAICVLSVGCDSNVESKKETIGDQGGLSLDSPNTVTLRSSSRTNVYSISSGEIWFRENWKPGVDQVVVNLNEGEAISGLTECESAPSITLSWLDSPFDFSRIVGRSIHIPRSYDDAIRDHVATFYNGEHLDFDDVRIDFIEGEGESLRLKMTGKIAGVNASGPETIDVEVDASIRFIDRNRRKSPSSPRTVEGVGVFKENDYYWTGEGRYDTHPVEIRLFADGNFERLADVARSIISEEGLSPAKIGEDIGSELPGLQWKFDDFGVKTNFEVGEFYPQIIGISQADDNIDGISLNIFLAHPDSGNDQWILRYVDRECMSFEWIPDR